MALSTVVVVGGSLAGIRSAEALRRRGFEGRLVFVGDEPERPYDRPPLSKEFLKGERELEKIQLTKPENFDALDLDLRLGRAATALESMPPERKTPTGTSLMSRRATASRSADSSRASASCGSPCTGSSQ